MTDTRTPAYCAKCGTKLVPSSDITGYDPYTGDPLEAQKLECPNPTVTVTGKRFTQSVSTTTHPTWNLVGTDGWKQGLSVTYTS